MKVYITKYALSRGILEREAELTYAGVIKAFTRDRGGNVWHSYHHGEDREWHRTLESAVAKAEAMRRRKIECLKAQIDRLEKLDVGKVAP